MKTRYLTLGALLAVVSAIFQCIPALFSEIFIFLTIFSSIPIYFMARKQPSIGILSYIVSFMLISTISPHENIIFLFTNGVVGLSLGLFSYYIDKKILVSLLSGLMLSISICIVNFIIGINIIGFSIKFAIIPLLCIYLFSFAYCLAFNVLCSFIYNRCDTIYKK